MIDRLNFSDGIQDIGDRIREEHGADAEAYFYRHYAHILDSEWFIEFDGMNCDDPVPENVCNGWDGDSHRCSCNNRRVDWSWDGKWLTAEAN